MRLARYARGSLTGYGRIEDDRLIPIADLSRPREQVAPAFDLAQVRLLAPCVPTKIVAVGLNYRTHAAELQMALPSEPLLFLKPPSAVTGPGSPIVCPSMASRVDYEAELAVVIGRRCRRIRADQAAAYILGYTCCNDVTARDLQQRDVQFTRSKSFDTFAPLGPWIVTGLNPADLRVESYVNGERRQSGTTADLVFPVEALVSFVSRVMTLEPGDVISTGTPAGVGSLQPGDTVQVAVEGIGVLANPVADAQP